MNTHRRMSVEPDRALTMPELCRVGMAINTVEHIISIAHSRGAPIPLMGVREFDAYITSDPQPPALYASQARCWVRCAGWPDNLDDGSTFG